MPKRPQSDGPAQSQTEGGASTSPPAPNAPLPESVGGATSTGRPPSDHAAPAATTSATKPPVPQRTARLQESRLADGSQPAPRSLAPLNRNKKMQREWVARIRIREDRLARLWVSNLTGHDVVVWSNKEHRWVALLAVPELRRALQAAESELPKDSRPVASRTSTVPPGGLSRGPDSLPPAPPLAMLNSAAAGVGELRLRSIAQSAAVDRGRASNAISRATFPPPLLHPGTRSSPLSHHRRAVQPRPRANNIRQPTGFGHWHWGAMERVAWMAAGVLAMFVVSGAGSADEKTERLEPSALLLTADRQDKIWSDSVANGNAPTLGASLLGPPQQCPIRPTYRQPIPGSPDETRAEEPNRENASNSRQRPAADNPQRPHVPASPRSDQEQLEQQPEVPADVNLPAIRAALSNSAALARRCPGDSIAGRAIVSFDPGGSVRSVDLPLLIGDRPDRGCIVRSFKNARVPPFAGRAVTVKKEF